MNAKFKDFKHGDNMPIKYTADGKNVNPQITVFDVPKEAKSLVLICEDPDAQRVVGYTYVHWVVFDIPINENKVIIEENTIPGIPGESTYKKPNYNGPNPPKGSGIHNYYFKIYALDRILGLPEMSNLQIIEEEMKGHILDSSTLIGKYSRS